MQRLMFQKGPLKVTSVDTAQFLFLYKSNKLSVAEE